ncbi:MAG: histidine kinase [Lachnospiraceae bacterium]|jgi:two-component system sensor histidine kinase YesM|nr:histidine kinase [Lachnospiraceae bacterium]
MGKMVYRFWHWFTGKASIRKKLIISFAVLVSIPITILGVYSFHVSNRNLLDQTKKTVDNNLGRLVMEMEAWFGRETDFTKFLAYHLSFRETLEKNPFDNVEIAQVLNKTVEPIFWYFISSDSNIKNIRIVTPYVRDKVGSFLEPSGIYEEEAWYQEHQENFRTKWTVEGDELYATRTVLDTATTSRPIGVMRTEFFLNRMLEPAQSMDYLENGILITDGEGTIIYWKKSPDEDVSGRILAMAERMEGRQAEEEQPLEAKNLGGQSSMELEVPIERGLDGGNDFFENGKDETVPGCILKVGRLESTGWRIYYYVEKKMISDKTNSIIVSTLVAVFGCMLVVLIFISIFSRTLSRRLLSLKEQAEMISGGNLEHPCYTEDTDEIGIVTNSLGRMTERLNDTINQVYKIEIEKKATELKALQAMINPHFLYNTLSSIKWKALKKGEEEISDITGLLAKFYRTTLNNGQPVTTVERELENVRAYIEILQRTKENGFAVEYRVDENGLGCEMLNFLLQPIVENAIEHGIDYIEEEEEEGLVIIEFCKKGQHLLFSVCNNGPVMDVEMLEDILGKPGKGYGIYNIQQRIAIYYGEDCGLSVKITEDGYTCFTIKIKEKG